MPLAEFAFLWVDLELGRLVLLSSLVFVFTGPFLPERYRVGVTMQWFDTHAHLFYPPLIDQLDEFLELARQAGVTGMLCVGTDLASSRQSVELAHRYPQIWAAVGIHPNECAKAETSDWEAIVNLSRDPRVVALGETGLDRHWDDAPFDLQQEYFQRHLDFSRESGLPFIVHMRDCESDIVAQLERQAATGALHGVMHSFTGTPETAEKCQQWGMYISFAGMATYKNAADIRQVSKLVRADRILVETDAPYLTPHPHRGQRPNHSAMVIHTGQCLAEERGLAFPDFARQTTENAQRLFNLS